MNGKTVEQIRNERKDTVSMLESLNYDVLDSVFEQPFDNWNNALYCLAKSLEMLSSADVCFFMKGWEHSRGCWLEHQACIRYGIEIMYE